MSAFSEKYSKHYFDHCVFQLKKYVFHYNFFFYKTIFWSIEPNYTYFIFKKKTFELVKSNSTMNVLVWNPH